MVALPLQHSFSLAFGEFHCLPRVLVRLTGMSERGVAEGIGEAAIDFPFVPYDLWDVYWNLRRIDPRTREYSSFYDGPFPPLPLSKDEYQLLLQYPASLAAFTAASDDLWGNANNVSLKDLFPTNRIGRPMVSIGFSTTSALIERVESLIRVGMFPKIKLGQGIETDVALVKAAVSVSTPKSLAADCNAAYTPSEAFDFFERLEADVPRWKEKFIMMEQPLVAHADLSVCEALYTQLASYGWDGNLIADEAVTDIESAKKYHARKWLINYKLQKMGGMREAFRIAAMTDMSPGMIGGTFPTAIGRAYDIVCAATIPLVTPLPSDAWEPSTNWFSGNTHLIEEQFVIDGDAYTHPFPGVGMGITPRNEAIERFLIPDPRGEYAAIRSGKSGKYIRIMLRSGKSYSDLYYERSGKDAVWNIDDVE